MLNLLNLNAKLLLLVVVTLSLMPFAHALTEFPQAPANPLPAENTPIAQNCSQLVENLAKFQSMIKSHEDSIYEFLAQFTGRILEWHTELTPLEEQMAVIPKGTFAGLERGAQQTQAVTGMAKANSKFLADELGNIMIKLPGCLKTE